MFHDECWGRADRDFKIKDSGMDQRALIYGRGWLISSEKRPLIPNSGGMIPISYKTKYKFDIIDGKAQCKGMTYHTTK